MTPTKPHEYGPALPGQGRDKICIRCGARKSVAGTSECSGKMLATTRGASR